MAEALCRQLGKDVECTSAGSAPADRVQPDTIKVMQEVGLDISNARPKAFSDLPNLQFDYLVTMGCEVHCPFLPGARLIQWQIPDPFGKGIEEYRKVRDTIHVKVLQLLISLNRLKRLPS